MNTIRYQLERDIESASVSNRAWLKERFIEVLESDKEVWNDPILVDRILFLQNL